MNYELKEALEKNQSKQCSVDGCCYPRYRLYSTCVHHFFRRRLYGSPKSKAIRKRDLQRDRDIVKRIVDTNESHRGIQKAIHWFDDWLHDAAAGRPVVAKRHIQRLTLAGITGKELVITCGALWAFSYRNPKFFPDKLSLAYGLSHQVMTLVPLEYTTTRNGKSRAMVMNGTDRRAIGEHIVNHIGMLFISICHHIERQEQEEFDARQAFCAAFK